MAVEVQRVLEYRCPKRGTLIVKVSAGPIPRAKEKCPRLKSKPIVLATGRYGRTRLLAARECDIQKTLCR